MNHENRDRLIAYSLLPFLTPSRSRLLREHFDPLESVASASPQFLGALLSVTPEQAELVKNPLTIVSEEKLAGLRDWTIALSDLDYPARLGEIIDPPLAMHFRGNRSLLDSPCVAVVGSRRASPYGIAVLGTGIDLNYPRSNTTLRRRIEAEGLVLSEFGPGTPPLPENFPVRNRVISGLSLGTLIVEATGRSGSLITARMAAEQGREVFAVPGSIFFAGTEGTHRLIQYGAKLVHDVADVLDELPGGLTAKTVVPRKPPPELMSVLGVLSREEACHIDGIAQRLSCAPGAVAESLLQLELGGWVQALPGGRYLRNPESG